MSAYRGEDENRRRREEAEARERAERAEAEALERYVREKRGRRAAASRRGSDGLTDGQREVRRRRDRIARVIGALVAAVGVVILGTGLSAYFAEGSRSPWRVFSCALFVGLPMSLWGLWRLAVGREREPGGPLGG